MGVSIRAVAFTVSLGGLLVWLLGSKAGCFGLHTGGFSGCFRLDALNVSLGCWFFLGFSGLGSAARFG